MQQPLGDSGLCNTWHSLSPKLGQGTMLSALQYSSPRALTNQGCSECLHHLGEQKTVSEKFSLPTDTPLVKDCAQAPLSTQPWAAPEMGLGAMASSCALSPVTKHPREAVSFLLH